MGIKLTKMQGCGNDFVILEYDEFLKFDLSMSDVAQKLCNRHFGVGADGLIIPNINSKTADIGWYFYNSDGSTAQMCGNGMRCFAKYVYDNKLVHKQEFTVETLAGIMKPQILADGNVCVNMSKPILESSRIPFAPKSNLNYKIMVDDKEFIGNAVSMGNPHFVIFVAREETPMELAKKYGSKIEISPEFPQKTNVEFIKILSSQEIDLAVWERGCGITLACGTGACASVVAGILNNQLQSNVKVNLPGGVVYINWDGTVDDTQKDVFLTGSAEYSFVAEI